MFELFTNKNEKIDCLSFLSTVKYENECLSILSNEKAQIQSMFDLLSNQKLKILCLNF